MSLLFALFFLFIIVFSFIFWIWMLIDCIQNPRLSSNERIIWILVVVFLHVLGAFIYFLAGRKR